MPSNLSIAIQNLTLNLTRAEVYEQLNTAAKADCNMPFILNRDEDLLHNTIKKGNAIAVAWLFDNELHAQSLEIALEQSVRFADPIQPAQEEKVEPTADLVNRRAILNLILQKTAAYTEQQFDREKDIKHQAEQIAEAEKISAQKPKSSLANLFSKKSNSSEPPKIIPLIPLAPISNRSAYLEALFYNNQRFLALDRYNSDYVINEISYAYATNSNVILNPAAEAVFLSNTVMPKYANAFMNQLLILAGKNRIPPEIVDIFPDLFNAMQACSSSKGLFFNAPEMVRTLIRIVLVDDSDPTVLQFEPGPHFWSGSRIKLYEQLEKMGNPILQSILDNMVSIAFLDTFSRNYHHRLAAQSFAALRKAYSVAFDNRISALGEKRIDELFMLPVRYFPKDDRGVLINQNTTLNLLSSPTMRSWITRTLKDIFYDLIYANGKLATFKILFSSPLHVNSLGNDIAILILRRWTNEAMQPDQLTELKSKLIFLQDQHLNPDIVVAKIIVAESTKEKSLYYETLSSELKNKAFARVIQDNHISDIATLHNCIAHEKAGGRPLTPFFSNVACQELMAASLFNQNCNFLPEFFSLPLTEQQTLIRMGIITRVHTITNAAPDVIYSLLDKLPDLAHGSAQFKEGLFDIGVYLHKMREPKEPAFAADSAAQHDAFEAFFVNVSRDVQRAILLRCLAYYHLTLKQVKPLLFLIREYDFLQDDRIYKEILQTTRMGIELGYNYASTLCHVISDQEIRNILITILESLVKDFGELSTVVEVMQQKQIASYNDLFSKYPSDKLESFVDNNLRKSKEKNLQPAWLDLLLDLIDKNGIKLKIYPAQEVLKKILLLICVRGNIEQFKLFIKNSPCDIAQLDLETAMEKNYNADGDRRIQCLIAAMNVFKNSDDDTTRLKALATIEPEDKAALRKYFMETRHKRFICDHFSENVESSPMSRRLSIFHNPQQPDPLKQFLVKLKADWTALPATVQDNPQTLQKVQELIDTFQKNPALQEKKMMSPSS